MNRCRALYLLVIVGMIGRGAIAGSPDSARFASILHPEKLVEMDAAIETAISNKMCPGGVLWFEHRGATYHKAYGSRSRVPSVDRMSEDTIFDAASLTKVIACTPA